MKFRVLVRGLRATAHSSALHQRKTSGTQEALTRTRFARLLISLPSVISCLHPWTGSKPGRILRISGGPGLQGPKSLQGRTRPRCLDEPGGEWASLARGGEGRTDRELYEDLRRQAVRSSRAGSRSWLAPGQVLPCCVFTSYCTHTLLFLFSHHPEQMQQARLLGGAPAGASPAPSRP